MVKDAEIGMYHAKRLGGDRIEAFRPALRQHGTDLAHARSRTCAARIGREEIKVLYQPIVRLEDRTIAGFEALVRWDHPKLGRIPPSDFIPIAERTGLIIPLGLFVLDRTARAARRLAGGPRPLGVAVRQRQRLEPPAAPPRPDQRREVGAGPLQHRAAARSSSR